MHYYLLSRDLGSRKRWRIMEYLVMLAIILVLLKNDRDDEDMK